MAILTAYIVQKQIVHVKYMYYNIKKSEQHVHVHGIFTR